MKKEDFYEDKYNIEFNQNSIRNITWKGKLLYQYSYNLVIAVPSFFSVPQHDFKRAVAFIPQFYMIYITNTTTVTVTNYEVEAYEHDTDVCDVHSKMSQCHRAKYQHS